MVSPPRVPPASRDDASEPGFPSNGVSRGGPAVRRLRTDDGSFTLERVGTGLTYRSRRGAVREALQVFVEASGVLELPAPRILEFGFGGGTNFAVTLERLAPRPFSYCAIEAEPVPVQDLGPTDPRVRRLVEAALEGGVARCGGVAFELHLVPFDAFRHPARFDVVYFDPFGPRDQPESWTTAIFEVARAHLSATGRLCTYSAAGWVRRNLAAAGFHVATVPGPAGKREVTLASPSPAGLGPLRIRNAPPQRS